MTSTPLGSTVSSNSGVVPVVLDHVRKVYDTGPDIAMDVTVGAAELFTLLGPSGCGKSTLLRMIAGFVAPTEGRILFGDKDVTGTPPHRRDTGMVFQNYALFPHMTVAQNVGYGLATRRVDRGSRVRRVAAALESVGLAEYGDRRIDQLSGGQQQRVALARAVVITPSVLLLDEPLSNLDAKLREETRAEIRRVQSEAEITTVYVTHDQAEAMAMSDRIAVLDRGRVHQIATPSDIYNCPATVFVARFIGGSNVVPVTVTGLTDDGVSLVLPGGASVTAPLPAFGPIAVGDELEVSLRPEMLGFRSTGDPVCRGQVTRIEFTGAARIYTVRSPEATLRVIATDDEPGRPRTGDAVEVGIVSGRPWLVRP